MAAALEAKDAQKTKTTASRRRARGSPSVHVMTKNVYGCHVPRRTGFAAYILKPHRARSHDRLGPRSPPSIWRPDPSSNWEWAELPTPWENIDKIVVFQWIHCPLGAITTSLCLLGELLCQLQCAILQLVVSVGGVSFNLGWISFADTAPQSPGDTARRIVSHPSPIQHNPLCSLLKPVCNPHTIDVWHWTTQPLTDACWSNRSG